PSAPPSLYSLSLHDALPICSSFRCSVVLRLECHLVHNANHRPLVSERKIVSVLTKVIVAKRRVPSEQEIFRLVHGDVHSVRNFQDRKSTRLNSSHVSISYAV